MWCLMTVGLRPERLFEMIGNRSLWYNTKTFQHTHYQALAWLNYRGNPGLF